MATLASVRALAEQAQTSKATNAGWRPADLDRLAFDRQPPPPRNGR
jgi:hypothetical protein